MGFRFNKRIRIAPGLSVNLSAKRGASVSIGPKGAKVNVGLDGRRRTTLSVPGTGISHVTEAGAQRQRNWPEHQQAGEPLQAAPPADHYSPREAARPVGIGGVLTWLLWTAIAQVLAIGVVGPLFGDTAGTAVAGGGALLALGLGIRAALRG